MNLSVAGPIYFVMFKGPMETILLIKSEALILRSDILNRIMYRYCGKTLEMLLLACTSGVKCDGVSSLDFHWA